MASGRGDAIGAYKLLDPGDGFVKCCETTAFLGHRGKPHLEVPLALEVVKIGLQMDQHGDEILVGEATRTPGSAATPAFIV